MPTAIQSGRPIHYEVFGHGPPLLLHHGILHHGILQRGSHWTRRGYTPALTDRHTVIEIDSLGHGASDAPHDPAAYALEQRVADAVSVLDDAGVDKVDVWGYSMGGWVACGLAARAPERCASLVVDGWDPKGGIQTAYAHFGAMLGIGRDVDWFDLLARQAAADPDQAEELAGGDRRAFRACLTALSGSVGLDAGLIAAGRPLMLYCGTADPYHDPARAIATGAGARFAAIAGADHQTAWRRADAVLPHVRPFLDAAAR